MAGQEEKNSKGEIKAKDTPPLPNWSLPKALCVAYSRNPYSNNFP